MKTRHLLFCTIFAAILHGVMPAAEAAPRVITAAPDDPRVVRAIAAMEAARRYGKPPAPRGTAETRSHAESADISRRARVASGGAATTSLGWAPYSGPWDRDDAAHLVRRALIGARWEEIEAAHANGLAATLAALLTAQPPPDSPGVWIHEPPPDWGNMTEQELQTLIDNYLDRQRWMVLWWVQQTANNQSTLTETMTLFWHDHFATNADGVFYPQAIYGQLDLLRSRSLGNFKTMTLDLCTDAAMLIWLNGDGNTVFSPNENFARELLELFTMGEGSGYTQQDVVETARACTGYITDGVDVFFIPQWHDNGSKTILGQTGNWGMTELVDIIFQQPATAHYVCEKLYTWFIDDQPDSADVEALAVTFRNANYEIVPVLQQMLGSDHFYNPTFRGSLIKSGVDMYAGNVRSLHAQGFDPFTTANEYETYWVLWQGYDIGQLPTRPPNVAGWPGHRNWINTATLPLRKEYAGMMLYGNMWSWPLGFQVDVVAEANRFGNPDDADQLVDDAALLMFDQPPTPLVRTAMRNALLGGMTPGEWSMNHPNVVNRLRAMFQFGMRLPDYQLK